MPRLPLVVKNYEQKFKRKTERQVMMVIQSYLHRAYTRIDIDEFEGINHKIPKKIWYINLYRFMKVSRVKEICEKYESIQYRKTLKVIKKLSEGKDITYKENKEIIYLEESLLRRTDKYVTLKCPSKCGNVFDQDVKKLDKDIKCKRCGYKGKSKKYKIIW